MYGNSKHTGYSYEEILFSLPTYPFSYVYLLDRLKSYKNPRNKIGLMIKKNHIIRVKKGLYVLPAAFGGKINKFLLANLIYGPSYVSFESALSYWGLIPEKVTTTIRC